MINNFVFNTINNNTAATNPVAFPYYTNYNLTTTVNIGQTYPLSVTIDPAGIYSGAIVSVWIDYNRDGTYAANEWQQVGLNITGGNTATINVTIPPTALPGLTSLRLRSRGAGNINNSSSGCLGMGSGETEDYQVNIQAAPVNPYTYTWNTVPVINGTTGNTVVTNNTASNITVNYVVTVVDQVTGCVNTDTTNNITVYPAILPPTVVGSAHCGIQVPTATANDVNGFVGPNYNWYATAVNANALQSSAANTYGSLIGNTTTLYVSVTDTLTGCETSSTPVTITVTAGPTLTLANTTTAICVGNSTNAIGLTNGAGTYNTFNWSPAAGVTGNEITGWTFNPAVSTVYTLTASQSAAPNCANQDTIAVTVDQVIPPAPTVPQNLVNACSGSNSILIGANTPTVNNTFTYTLNFFDSFGDGWNNNTINVNVNGIPLLNGVTLPNGSIGSATFTVNGGDAITTQFNAIGSWINECTYNIVDNNGNVIFSGTPASAVGPPSLTSPYIVPTIPTPNYVINWYNASTNGAFVGTGSPFETVGTTVMPVANNGTYMFYAGTSLGACNSATTVPVTVNVADVSATITAINATCNSVANGSFTATNFTCGTGPFTYSLDNGPFGAIPTNIAAGPHTVVIRDANNLLSSIYNITITQPAWTVNAPTVGPNAVICANDPSALLNAASTLNGITTTITDTIVMASGVNFPGGGVQTFTQNVQLPANAVVTNTVLSVENVYTSNFGWPADYLISMSGASTLPNQTLANVFTEVTNAGPYVFSPSGITAPGGNVTVTLNNTSGPGVGYFGNIFLFVTYTVPANASAITWWNATTGGTQVAIGDTIESIGTTILPTSLNAGVYNFYAQGEGNGCSSLSRTLVTVTVNALPNVNGGNNVALCIGQSATLTASGATTYTWNNGISNGVSFTPNATNNYVVTGVDNNGCINHDTVTVVVNALPNVFAGNNQTVCLNTPVVLSGSGAATYVWNNNVVNNTPFTPVTTNNYVVTGTDANGCVNTDTTTVTVLPLPVVNAGQDFAICIGAGASLSGAGAQTYQWNNGVLNAVTFFPTSTQTYTVIGTGANGCSSQDSVVVTVNTVPTISLTNGGGACANGNVALNASTTNAFGGFWATTNGGGVISPNVSNNAVVYAPGVNDPNSVNFTYVAFNQCGSATANTNIVVLPLPAVNAGLDVSTCTGNNVTLSATASGNVVWNNGVLDGVAFAASVGNSSYVATATAANGCTNSDTVVVTGLVLPQVNAGQDQTICAGEFVTLNAAGALTYTWNNNVIDGVPFAPNATGTYTVTGTGANGCTNQDNVTVTVHALPVAGIVMADPVTLVATPAGMTYLWYNCATAQAIIGAGNDSLVASANGSYAVIVTNANGCTDTSNCVVVDQVGIYFPASAEIALYPNPTSDFVTLTLPAEDGAVAFVYDAQGKLIFQVNNAKNGQQFDLSALSTGVYTFRVTLNNLTHIEKVVKQ
jgi:hypothetical protein